jgi:hypothetical protein
MTRTKDSFRAASCDFVDRFLVFQQRVSLLMLPN